MLADDMVEDELWDVRLVEQSPALATRILAIGEQTSVHDGVSPLNEQGLRILAGQLPGHHVVAHNGDQLVGYAQVDVSDLSAQLFVIPDARRQGIGRALAELANRQVDRLEWWSFGTLAPARALAASMGLRPVRGLLKMAIDPTDTDLPDPGAAPEGATISTFTEADIDDLVRVNALAFADHPEQGQMSRKDVEDKMAEDWFEADGLFLARDGTGQLLGYHWTKLVEEQHPQFGPRAIGEVYVIGVHPFENGRGLGRHLLAVGLRHLARRKAALIELYVEAENDRVVQMYERAGFREVLRDTRWG